MPIGKDEHGALYWDASGAAIVHSDPRILAITAQAAGLRLVLVAAHAPTSKTPQPVLEAWWARLHAVIRKAPSGFAPILFIDANSKFEWAKHPPSAASALSANGQALAQLLAEQQLAATPNMHDNGDKLFTWRGPQGAELCLDHIACPTRSAQGMLLGTLDWFEGKVAHDHRPLAVLFQWKVCSGRAPARPRFDTKRMLTAQGRQQVRRIFAQAPAVDWEADVDTHLQLINTYLVKSLCKEFPVQASEPRSYVLQTQTWNLVQDRRELQRRLHQCKRARAATLLQQCFHVWCGRAAQLPDGSMWDLAEALYASQLQDLRRLVRRSSQQDLALAAQHTIETARARGPECMHQQFRRIMRCGRRYREPPIQPAVRAETGKFAADSYLHLGQHFAKAERALQCSPADVATVALSPPELPLQATNDLGIAALAQGYGALKTGRAAGPSGLPAELYRADPIGAAHLHQPLLLKSQLAGVLPGLWRGGRNVPIPKPEKPLQSADSWRAILLSECALKGICKALRAPLLRCLEAIRTPAQGGSRAGAPLQGPMAIAQAHIRALHRDKACGGLLMVDGRQAFYATTRQRLLGKAGELPSALLHELADAIFEEPGDRLRFMTEALGPGLLSHATIPEEVRRVICASLRDTWFVIGAQQTYTFATRSGTAPGSPLADILFQMTFAEAMHKVEATMQEVATDVARRAAGPAAPFVPAPSWMDDLSVPLRAVDVLDLQRITCRVIQVLWKELRAIGVDINFSRGKTELLPVLHGAGSRKARQEWLCERGAQLLVALGADRSEVVHVTASYVHLGARIDGTNRDLASIRHRLQLTREMIRPLQRLFRNPFITPDEKVHLLRSMPLARLRHGSGFWRTDCTQSRRAYAAAYNELPRRMFRYVTGLSTQGLTDDDVCLILGLATAAEARAADLVRHAVWIFLEPLPVLHDMWRADHAWMHEVQQACQCVAARIEPELRTPWERFLARPAIAITWSKRFLRRCVKDRRDARAARTREAQAMQRLREAGCILCHRGPHAPDKRPLFQCEVCGDNFSTAAAKASHLSKVHGKTAAATAASAGSACPVCRTEFWTTKRLKDHLRRSPRCLCVTVEADIQADVADNVRGSQQAWLPATRLVGPQPWWACQRPADTNQTAAPWEPAFHREVQRLVAGEHTGAKTLRGAVRAAVEKWALVGHDEEDLPMSVCRMTAASRDLVRLIVQVCNFQSARSATMFTVGAWSAHLCAERVLLCPSSLVLHNQAELIRQLPTEWKRCLI